VALCQARISTKPLWGFSSSNPYPTQSRAEHYQYMYSVSQSTELTRGPPELIQRFRL
jgi:hypothetical protein